MTTRRPTALLALAVALTAAAAASAPGLAAPRTLPSPFVVTAVYSAKSLGLDDPRAFAIGPDGDLYVTDRSQRVSVISAHGKVLRRWGKPGSGPGKFSFARGDPSDPNDIHGQIAVGPNGLVYVSDSGNARVQVFTPKGRFLRQFGSFGNARTQFLSPFDLVVDETGDVYVADDQLGTLSKFSPGGKFVWRIGGTGFREPDLVGYFKVTTIDAHGRLVVANDARGKVVYLDRDGHEIDAFPVRRDFKGEPAPCGATVDTSGSTYVTGCKPGATLVYSRAHRLVAKWPGSSVSLFTSPRFGPRGEVFALAWDGSILELRVTLPG